MRMTTLARGVAAGAVAVLVGCGGGGGDRADGGGEDDGLDPISEFLSGGDFDEEASQQQFLEQERERQTLVAECMAAQGFEYVPIEPGQGMGISSYPGEGLSPAEFTEEYGYGMATLFEEGIVSPEDSEFVDPNAETVEAMSETERLAWDTALYGSFEEQSPPLPAGDAGEERATETTVDEATVDESFYGGGCEGEASEAVYAGQEDQFEEFDDLFEDYDERLRSDRRFVDAEAAWVSCMAEEGYDFAEVKDAANSVNERMEEVYSSTDPTAGMSEEELAALSPEELEELYQVVSEPDPELLAEIQGYELEVAAADFACAADIRDATNDVAQTFLDEHRAEFERYRDAMLEQTGAG